jgi:hypothetical protein
MRRRFLSFLAICAFFVGLFAFAGCGGLVNTLLEDDEEPPVKNEAGVRAIGQQFGEAIQKENYPAAYQLLTNSRRAEQTLEQFTAKCKQQRQDYFEGVTPTQVDTYAYMPRKDDLPDWTGLPADVKYDSLLGVCTAIWSGEPDLQLGETELYLHEVDVGVVDEAGQPKIAYIDWEDELLYGSGTD